MKWNDDFTAPPKEPTRQVLARFALVISVNIGLVFVAWVDQSWLSFGIAVFGGPIVNLVIGGILALLPFPQTVRDVSTGERFGLAILFIVIPIIVDVLVIFSMDLHGC